jgi:hypothetical protein
MALQNTALHQGGNASDSGSQIASFWSQAGSDDRGFFGMSDAVLR